MEIKIKKRLSALFFILFVICLFMTGMAMVHDDLIPSLVFSVLSLINFMTILHLDKKTIGGN